MKDLSSYFSIVESTPHDFHYYNHPVRLVLVCFRQLQFPFRQSPDPPETARRGHAMVTGFGGLRPRRPKNFLRLFCFSRQPHPYRTRSVVFLTGFGLTLCFEVAGVVLLSCLLYFIHCSGGGPHVLRLFVLVVCSDQHTLKTDEQSMSELETRA